MTVETCMFQYYEFVGLFCGFCHVIGRTHSNLNCLFVCLLGQSELSFTRFTLCDSVVCSIDEVLTVSCYPLSPAGADRLGRIQLTLRYSDTRGAFVITVHKVS